MYESQDFLAASDYLVAWSIYVAAALILLALLWYTIRRWWPELRWLLVGLSTVVLLLPSPVPGHAALAPALAFLTLGVMSGQGADELAPVLVKLLLAVAGVVGLVIGAAVFRRRRLTAARHKHAGARARPA